MKNESSLTKKTRAETFVLLVNKFLESEINKETLLSDSEKIDQYWELFGKCLVIDGHDKKNKDAALNNEEKVNDILYYQQLVKFFCVDLERYSKFRGIEYKKIKKMGDWETFIKLDTLWNNLQEDDELMNLLRNLKKCEDNLCGNWFVRRPKKIFCRHGCASRYRKRMKEGKGDQQTSYRPRGPNKKKRSKL